MFLVRFGQTYQLPIDTEDFLVYFYELAFLHVSLSALDSGIMENSWVNLIKKLYSKVTCILRNSCIR